MIKYRADSACLSIKRYSVNVEENGWIYIIGSAFGSREKQEGIDYEYFDDFESAREWLIDNRQKEILQAKIFIDLCEKQLESLKNANSNENWEFEE